MTEERDSFQADGKPEGVLYGFLTNGANISIGGRFEGKTRGLEGVCNDGDAVFGSCGSNAHAGVSATNDSGGFGVWARGTPGGHFESNSGDAVFGSCGSNAHAGVSATNDSGGFGVWARGTPGAHFESNSGTGVAGSSNGGSGVTGNSATSYGGQFTGGFAPLYLSPSASTGHPTSGDHKRGEFYVDRTGSLFYCKADGIPGTWAKLA